MLSARGVEYGIEIRAGETLLYRYEDNAFPKNAQMKGRLWADTELPYGLGGQTLSLTFTELPGRMCRIDAPVLGSMPAVTGRHIQSSLFSVGMILVMLVLAVLALLIFLYMSFYGIRERRFLDTAVFLLLCSLWCMTDSGLYQLYGADTAAGSVVSFYAFMTMAIPMVHFVRNTVSGRLRLVPDVCIALLCVNALAQGAAYRLFGVPFIDMLPLTHLLLTAGVAAMLTVLFRSYRAQPAPQLRLRMAAFAALGAFGVAALVLYWLLHIYWYDAVYQFGVLLFIILLLHGLISQAAEDMRFHMEHRISHEMQREDRMTGLPNRRAFEEYMERVRTGEAGCLDAVLTYIRLEGLNERNDRFGLQAGDEAVIAAARCVSDFCRECEDEGESVLCFRTGGNEFALIRPEPHIDSGQLHRQFRAVVGGGDHDDRNLVDPAELVHVLEHGKAVHLRHIDVEQHQIDVHILLEHPERLRAVHCLCVFVSLAQDGLEHFSVHLRVVNDQDFLSVHSRSTAAGSLSLPLSDFVGFSLFYYTTKAMQNKEKLPASATDIIVQPGEIVYTE